VCSSLDQRHKVFDRVSPLSSCAVNAIVLSEQRAFMGLL